jgi:hypothetical protein
LAQTGPRAVSMRQMSEETPPVSGLPVSGSSPARPSSRSAASEFGGHRLRAAKRRQAIRLRFDELHQRVQRLIDRRRDAELATAPRDEAVEVVDLARLAARHVLRGRRELARHRAARCLHRRERAHERQRDAVGRRDAHHLATTACCSSRIAGSAAMRPVRHLGETRRSRCRRSSPSASTTARP